jgi:hypothetical protein
MKKAKTMQGNEQYALGEYTALSRGGTYNKKPDELMEFYCCETGESVETDYCELMACNLGCRNLKTCPVYQKQRKFQEEHQQACWDVALNREYNLGFQEIYRNLLMRKKNIIIDPVKPQNSPKTSPTEHETAQTAIVALPQAENMETIKRYDEV